MRLRRVPAASRGQGSLEMSAHVDPLGGIEMADGASDGRMPGKVGKYRVDELIGRGAMGVVYKGFDEQIDRPVAIKTLRLDIIVGVEDREALLSRFSSEARAAGRCVHPNIVTVFDYVEHDGAPYLIMGYVPAGTLENVIRSGPLLPIRQVGEIMIQLLFALGHAHSKGLVHRDVKPANILCPTATSIKVTDFGVARFDSLQQTSIGLGVIGTPNYMAPEQFLGRKADARSDLFAASVILFQLLTQAKPFAANDTAELMRLLLNERPPHLSAFRAGDWSAMDEVVQRGLARNPEDRYQNAEAFIDAMNVAIGACNAENAPPLDLTKFTLMPSPEAAGQGSDGLGRTMAEKLAPRTLGALEQSLAHLIGPIAPVLIKRISKQATDADKFLSLLAEQIPESNEATQFRTDAERVLRSDEGVVAIQLESVIPPIEVRAATEALLPLIGPMARIVAERRAQTAMGREDYYTRLADSIPDEPDREAFLKKHLGATSHGKK